MKIAERYGISRGPVVYDNSADGESDPFFHK
jgi:hypothetical protein